MANFNEAYNITFKHEAGYAGDLGDGGGETYCGITRKNFPNWPGWKHVDAAKRQGKLKRYGVITTAPVPQLVRDFYKTNFWDAIVRGDEIANQSIANFSFDWTFNSGISVCERISRAVATVAPANTTLKASKATLTPDVIQAANNTPAPAYAAIWEARRQHIAELAKIPSKKQFVPEWTRRLNTFPPRLVAVATGLRTLGGILDTFLKAIGL